MQFSFVYILHRFLYRIWEFFHHWYIHGSRNIFHYFVNLLEGLDRTFALRVTLRYFFEPLYKDYTVVGRILGIVFRSGRALIAFVFYIFIAAIFAAVYLVWLVLPPAMLVYVFYSADL